eukprot:m.319934 g.319934  ORF g.319934 m.319934 type:complete len:55 (-) comp16517_c0_seq108:2049-2213(-)
MANMAQSPAAPTPMDKTARRMNDNNALIVYVLKYSHMIILSCFSCFKDSYNRIQ